MLDRLCAFFAKRKLGFWIALLVVMAGVFVFVQIAEEVQEGDTTRWDTAVFLAIADADVGGELDEVGRDLTALGGFAIVGLAILGVTGFLLIERKFAAAILAVVSTLTGLGISMLLKSGFNRPRPDLVEHGSHVVTASFPSGHSMLSATVYLTLGLLVARFSKKSTAKVFAVAFAVLLTALVGLSRVFLGVHWPTDVLAGWAGGATWAVLCYIIAGELQQRGQVEKPEEHTEDLKDSPLQSMAAQSAKSRGGGSPVEI